MKISKFSTITAASVTALALAFGGVAANATTSPSVDVEGSTAVGGKTVLVLGDDFSSNATVTLTLGSTTQSLSSSSSGHVAAAVKLPSKAGVYTLRLKSGSKKVTETVSVGSAYTAATVRATKITKKSTHKTTVRVTGAVGSTVTVKVTGPSGSTSTTKTVKLTNGYKYLTYTGATKKGTYTVTVTYKSTSTKYGAKSYTTTFKKTR